MISQNLLILHGDVPVAYISAHFAVELVFHAVYIVHAIAWYFLVYDTVPNP